MFSAFLFIFVLGMLNDGDCLEFTRQKMLFYRDKVRSMFYHAYEGYLRHAYPYDELKPITCSGVDTWGGFSLTLVDALDTLLIMGNHSEFARASKLVLKDMRLNANVNVSVFETNIRVIAGLLSAHMLAGRAGGYSLGEGWPCSGDLLALAERLGRKLLPAFSTETGMPFGSINLKYGVNRFETPVTCTAGVGTFLLEFGTLSRMTGNPLFERLALKALDRLWFSRSKLGLVGNHINVQTGLWTATDSGIGAGVDSYFESLVKGAILFNKPRLMQQFNAYRGAIEKHVRKDDWFLWVSMSKAGQVSMPIFQSLEAFWPGLLTLVGDLEDAMSILMQYNQILKQYGFLPEFYNIPNLESVHKRSGYPLRPEMVESLMYLYRATGDQQLLQIGVNVIEAIEHSAKTPCGYATVHNVKDHMIEDRMESFFLAETTKYLYLLFDEDNFIHNKGETARLIDTPNGKCVIEAGGYIFNTEAHPIDPGIVYCCSVERKRDAEMINEFHAHLNLADLFDFEGTSANILDEEDTPSEVVELGSGNFERRKAENETETFYAESEHEEENEAANLNEDGGGETVEVGYETPTEKGTVEVNASAPPRTSRQHPMGGAEAATPTQTVAPPVGTDEAAKTKVENEMEQLLTSLYGDDFDLKGKNVESLQEVVDLLVENWNDLLRSQHRLEALSRELGTLPPCADCCRLTDVDYRSENLNRLLAIIYRNTVYKHLPLKRQYPICRRKLVGEKGEEHFSESMNYENETPEMPRGEESRGINSVDGIVLERRRKLRYGRFNKFVMLARKLLSCRPQPFLARFLGMGQVSVGKT